jgi:hypothetical protein
MPTTRARRARPATGSLVICGRCHWLRGPVPDRDDGAHQLCRCGPAEERQAQPLWGGDHNTYAELCRCCALRLLPSGSRWSVWLCDDCKPLVVSLNRQLGRTVVPIGRHSLMHGLALRPSDVHRPDRVEHFVADVHGLAGLIGGLETYSRGVIARTEAALGFDPTADVFLGKYLWAVDRSELEPAGAFVSLALHVLLPDVA